MFLWKLINICIILLIANNTEANNSQCLPEHMTIGLLSGNSPYIQLGAEYIINILNQWDNNSFLPDLTIDLKIYNRCESLLWTSSKCPLSPIGIIDSNPSQNILCPVDNINEVLRANYIPLVLLQSSWNINILSAFINHLNWKKISIIYDNNELSKYIVKQLGQQNLCIDFLISLSNLSSISNNLHNNFVFNTNNKSSPTPNSLKNTNRIQYLWSKINNLPKDSVIIVINEPLDLFLILLEEHFEDAQKYQWLLISNLPPKIIKKLTNHNLRIYSITPFPSKISSLEALWSKHSNSNLSLETPLDILWRTSSSLPAIYATFNFAYALRNAWLNECSGRLGLCDQLRLINRQDFITKYLEPLHFDYSTIFTGTNNLNNYGLDFHLAFTSFINDTYMQYLIYDTKKIQVLSNLNLPKSTCPKNGCNSCIKIRAGRLENSEEDEYNEGYDKSNESDNKHKISEPNEVTEIENNEDEENYQANVIIPLILPIHKKGDGFFCSKEINPPAIYDLEAALWILDQMNIDQYTSGLKYSIAVIDSCSSPAYLTTGLSQYLIRKHINKIDDVFEAIGFISSLPLDQTQAVITLLEPLNISLISANDLTPLGVTLGSTSHRFQTAVPFKKFVQAAIQQLLYFGWKYVTIVKTRTSSMYDEFKEAAGTYGICIATVVNFDDPSRMMKLKHSSDNGIRVVLIFGDTISTQELLSETKHLVAIGNLEPNEWIWMIVSESNLNIVNELESEALGALVIRESQVNVKTFIEYFAQLKPDNNTRNPWFRNFWYQSTDCKGPKCILNQMNPISTVNTMQAIISLISSFKRLRDELCEDVKGFCQKLKGISSFRSIISKYIHFTGVILKSGSKQPKDRFSYTEEGYGAKNLDILNFKRSQRNRYRFDHVATFSNQLVPIDGRKYLAYKEDHEFLMEAIHSECHNCGCSRLSSFVVPSRDSLYIGAAIQIHETGSSPFTCGAVSPTGIAHLEALLYAIDIINSHPSILPGITLGSVILDTCSSPQRLARDVSNVLSDLMNLPSSSSIVGFLTDSSESKMVDNLIDLTVPVNIATFCPYARLSKYDDPSLAMIRMVPSNQVYSDALLSLLIQNSWTYISIIIQENIDFDNILTGLKSKLYSTKIQIALEERFSDNPDLLTGTLNRLFKASETGAKVVILLMDKPRLTTFLSRVQNDPHELLWVGLETQIFSQFSHLSSLSLTYSSPQVTSFNEYFLQLNPKNNSHNPWYLEYFERINNCRGKNCYSGKIYRSLPPTISATPLINSVFAFAHGLEQLRRSSCSKNDLCHDFRSQLTASLLISTIKHSVFTGIDNQRVLFFNNLNYPFTSLNIYVTPPSAAPSIGLFNERDGLMMTSTLSIRSKCITSCTKSSLNPTIQISRPLHSLSIGALLPIHKPGTSLFSCGQIDLDIFPLLLAFNYAMDKINSNKSILGDTHIGSIVMDYCGRKERASQNLWSYFAGNIGSEVPTKSLIAMITFDNIDVDSILSNHHIVHINIPLMYDNKNNSIKEQPPSLNKILTLPNWFKRIEVMMDILHYFNWTNGHLIHSRFNSKLGGNEFTSKLTKLSSDRDLCLNIIDLTGLDEEGMEKYLRSNLSDRGIVINLLDDSTNLLLFSNRFKDLFRRFLWIGDSNLMPFITTYLSSIDAIIVTTESYPTPLFSAHLSNISLSNYSPIPTLWFNQFWQEKFKCSLPQGPISYYDSDKLKALTNLDDSHVPYRKQCTGHELLTTSSSYAHFIINSVKVISLTIDEYLRRYCVSASSLASIDDCSESARDIIAKGVQENLNKLADESKRSLKLSFDKFNESSKNLSKSSHSTIYGFHLYHNNAGSLLNIGIWRNSLLEINQTHIALYLKSYINDLKCSKCCSTIMPSSSLILSASSHNFILTSLSIIGLLAVIICLLYFAMVFSISVGTTILGYFILFGLLTIYCSQFLFLIPNALWAINIGLPLAYSCVLSGMLVKVLNTWRTRTPNLPRNPKTPSPTSLICLALALTFIQLGLTLIWLMIFPPQPSISFIPLSSILPLIYLIILGSLIVIFSSLTWFHRESHYILFCVLLVGLIWLCYALSGTDISLALPNLLSATVVLIGLYGRKFRTKKRDPMVRDSCFYGSVTKPTFPIWENSLFYRATRAPFEGDADDGASSCGSTTGSVQVQAEDLYPMEVYDGYKTMSIIGSNVNVYDSTVIK